MLRTMPFLRSFVVAMRACQPSYVEGFRVAARTDRAPAHESIGWRDADPKTLRQRPDHLNRDAAALAALALIGTAIEASVRCASRRGLGSTAAVGSGSDPHLAQW